MQYKEIITFETFEVIDKIIYAQFVDKNILFRFSKEDNGVEIINRNIDYRFKHCTSLNNKLYFADNLGEVLVEYNIKNNLYKIYNLDTHMKDDNNIVDVLNCGKYIYVVSQHKGTLFIFDIENQTLEREEALERKIKKIYKDYTECFIRCWKIGEYLYFIINDKDDYDICRYDLTERELEELPKKEVFYGMIDAYCFEQKLYILQNEYSLIIWNIEDNTIETLDIEGLGEPIDNNKIKEGYFFSMAVTKKNIWLFPTGDNEDIYVYDIVKKKSQIYNKYPSDFYYQNKKKWAKYADIKEREGLIYVAARMANYFLIIDVETGIETWKSTGEYDFSEYYYDYYSNLIGGKDSEEEKQKVVYEKNNIMFDIFLKYKSSELHNIENSDKVGNKIWEAFK